MVKVLIVDDELPLLRNLASYVGSFRDEFEVVTAASGEEAEQALRDHPDLVLMLTDVRLPGIDGIELVRRAAALRPQLRVVVMTAYPSHEMRRSASAAGALRYVEKPLDLRQLRTLLLEAVGQHDGWSGEIGGLDIFDFTQLFAMSGKNTALRVTWHDLSGVLVFRDGNLLHASCAGLAGDDAFYFMTTWPGGTFEEVPPEALDRHGPNVRTSTNHLLLEAARLRDERQHGAAAGQDDVFTGPPDDAEVGPSRATAVDTEEDTNMAIKEHLGQLEGIEGFQGAAVFTAQGEMLEGLARAGLDIKSVGIYANNALLNAQKATDQMGVGRGNFMQIRAPQAIVLMRCLNEATDFAAVKEGKAHFHTVCVLSPEGNIGMAGMVLDKIVVKIAEEVR
jgi:CheY-like chemotaxis protein